MKLAKQTNMTAPDVHQRQSSKQHTQSYDPSNNTERFDARIDRKQINSHSHHHHNRHHANPIHGQPFLEDLDSFKYQPTEVQNQNNLQHLIKGFVPIGN